MQSYRNISRIKLWLQPDGCPVLDTTATIAARKRAKLLCKDQRRDDEHTVEGTITSYLMSNINVLDADRPCRNAGKQVHAPKHSTSNTEGLWLFEPDTPNSICGSAHLISLVNKRWQVLQDQAPATTAAALEPVAQQLSSSSSIGTSWSKLQQQLGESAKLLGSKDLVGRRIQVWWPDDNKSYEGLVTDYYCHHNSSSNDPPQPDTATDNAENPSASDPAAARDVPKRGHPIEDPGSGSCSKPAGSGQGKDTSEVLPRKRGRPPKQDKTPPMTKKPFKCAQECRKRGRPPKPRGQIVWGKHRVVYDDGEVELIDLNVEEWRLTEAELNSIKQQRQQPGSKESNTGSETSKAKVALPAAGDVLLTLAVDRHTHKPSAAAAAAVECSRKAGSLTNAAVATTAGSGRSSKLVRQMRRKSSPGDPADTHAKHNIISRSARTQFTSGDSDSHPSSSESESSSGSDSSDSDYALDSVHRGLPSSNQQEHTITKKRQAGTGQAASAVAAAAGNNSAKRSKAASATAVVAGAAVTIPDSAQQGACPKTAAAVPLTVHSEDTLSDKYVADAQAFVTAVKPEPALGSVSAAGKAAIKGSIHDTKDQRKSPFLGILASKFQSYIAGACSVSHTGHTSLQAATAAAAAAAMQRAAAARAASVACAHTPAGTAAPGVRMETSQATSAAAKGSSSPMMDKVLPATSNTETLTRIEQPSVCQAAAVAGRAVLPSILPVAAADDAIEVDHMAVTASQAPGTCQAAVQASPSNAAIAAAAAAATTTVRHANLVIDSSDYPVDTGTAADDSAAASADFCGNTGAAAAAAVTATAVGAPITAHPCGRTRTISAAKPPLCPSITRNMITTQQNALAAAAAAAAAAAPSRVIEALAAKNTQYDSGIVQGATHQGPAAGSSAAVFDKSTSSPIPPGPLQGLAAAAAAQIAAAATAPNDVVTTTVDAAMTSTPPAGGPGRRSCACDNNLSVMQMVSAADPGSAHVVGDCWQHVAVLKAAALQDKAQVKPVAAVVAAAANTSPGTEPVVRNQAEADESNQAQYHHGSTNEHAAAIAAITPARKLLDELTARVTLLDAATHENTEDHDGSGNINPDSSRHARVQMQMLHAKDNMQFSLLTELRPLRPRGHKAGTNKIGHTAATGAAATAVSTEGPSPGGLLSSCADDDSCLAVLLVKLPADFDPATVTVTSSSRALEIRYHTLSGVNACINNPVPGSTDEAASAAAAATAADVACTRDQQKCKQQQPKAQDVTYTVCLPTDMIWVTTSSSSVDAAAAAAAAASDSSCCEDEQGSPELVGLLQYSSTGGRLMVLGRCCRCRPY